jgi:hypothetical protein
MQRIQTDNDFLNRVQDAILAPLNALIMNPILNGRLVETMTDANGHEQPIVIRSAAGYTKVPHKLGRRPRGWFIISPTSAYGPTVYGDVNEHNDDHLVLYLANNDTDTTIKLWVF